jgi:transcriptional regulator with XRE-family HTH domain
MDHIEELQKKIKTIIKELGLTQTEMARRVYCERFENDDPEETHKFIDTFRQNLKRKAKPELLKSYLANIANLREFKNSDLAISSPLDLGFISIDIKRALEGISKELISSLESENNKL